MARSQYQKYIELKDAVRSYFDSQKCGNSHIPDGHKCHIGMSGLDMLAQIDRLHSEAEDKLQKAQASKAEIEQSRRSPISKNEELNLAHKKILEAEPKAVQRFKGTADKLLGQLGKASSDDLKNTDWDGILSDASASAFNSLVKVGKKDRPQAASAIDEFKYEDEFAPTLSKAYEEYDRKLKSILRQKGVRW